MTDPKTLEGAELSVFARFKASPTRQIAVDVTTIEVVEQSDGLVVLYTKSGRYYEVQHDFIEVMARIGAALLAVGVEGGE